METDHRQAEGLTPQDAPPAQRPITAPPRRRRSPLSTLLWAVIFAVVVIAIIVFALTRSGGAGQAGPGGGGHGRGGGRFGNMASTVSVAQITRGDVPVYLNELGTVTPLATVTVTSQVSGFLTKLGFQEGQLVHKGQFLAQIDPRPYEAALLQAQGALARDEASLAQARLDLKRYQLLLSQDSIASQTVDQQAATVKADEGTVATDRANVRTAQLNLQYAHVTSPIDGRAGLRLVDEGNYVSTVANTTATNSVTSSGIVVVTQLTPMDVAFTLPEDDLPQVQSRLHAGATLAVTAYDRTGQTVLAHGRLLALDSQVDSATGTVRAKARFDNGAGTLFPQQFVNVRILVDTLRNTVVAPNTAVLRGANGLYVYVVQGGQNHHTVTIKNVQTGDSDGTNTAILSGVNPGDTVVTDGSDRLREGAPVLLPGDCIPAFGGGRGGHGGHHGGGGGGWSGGQAGGASGAPGQDGCPKGETRLTPAGAKAGADSASAASGAASGPGSTSGASGADSGSGSPAAGGAQNEPAGHGQGGEGPGQNQGGRMQAMLSQLNLDAQQQLKAQAIFGQARAQAMNGAAAAGEDPDAMRQARRQAFDHAFDQLNAILRPDQKAKLAQLRAQMQQDRAQRGGDQGGGQ